MKITDYLDNFMLHGIPIIALATIPVLYSKNPTYKDAIIGPAAYITGFCISKIHDKLSFFWQKS